MMMSNTKWRLILYVVPILIQSVQVSRLTRQSGRVSKCTTPNSESGKCTPITNCEPLYDLLRKRGSENSVIEFMRRSQCGFLGNTPTVCCPVDDVATITPSSPSSGTGTSVSGSFSCGVSTNSKSKIVGGAPAEAGAWPWIVALGYDRGNGGEPSFSCGGTLVSDRHVVTASHCILNLRGWKLSVLRLGDLNLDPTVPDGSEPITVDVGDIITHPGYTDNPVTNDIAIVKLKQPVTFTKFIQPICLPDTEQLRTDTFNKKQPIIMGWGALAYRGATTNILMEGSVPTVDIETCKKNYANEYSARIDERVICAGGKGQNDTCQGDSGGPLILPFSNDNGRTFKYYIIGIVSFGKRCAEKGYPGVYTRVTHFLDWIQQNMN